MPVDYNLSVAIVPFITADAAVCFKPRHESDDRADHQ